jgi:hypothetical protein
LHGNFKEAAVKFIDGNFFHGIKSTNAVDKAEIIKKLVPKLTDNLEYIFPLEVSVLFEIRHLQFLIIIKTCMQFSDPDNPTSFACVKNQPYGQAAIVSVLCSVIFAKGKNSPAVTFTQYFGSSLDDNDEKEIPVPMMCLMAIAVRLSYIISCCTCEKLFFRYMTRSSTGRVDIMWRRNLNWTKCRCSMTRTADFYRSYRRTRVNTTG